MTDAHIVRAFTIGPTRILISDDCYRGRTPGDTTGAVRELSRTARAYLSAAASEKEGARKPVSYFRTCPQCGAHLDPGESCDCAGSAETRENESGGTEKGGEDTHERSAD